MATPADVKSRYPTFAGIEDSVIQAHINKVTDFDCPSSEWPDVAYREEGILLCVAHYLTLEMLQQAMISAISTGVSKGNQPSLNQLSGKQHWELTVYGLQFRDFQKTLPISGFAFGAY